MANCSLQTADDMQGSLSGSSTRRRQSTPSVLSHRSNVPYLDLALLFAPRNQTLWRKPAFQNQSGIIPTSTLHTQAHKSPYHDDIMLLSFQIATWQHLAVSTAAGTIFTVRYQRIRFSSIMERWKGHGDDSQQTNQLDFERYEV